MWRRYTMAFCCDMESSCFYSSQQPRLIPFQQQKYASMSTVTLDWHYQGLKKQPLDPVRNETQILMRNMCSRWVAEWNVEEVRWQEKKQKKNTKTHIDTDVHKGATAEAGNPTTNRFSCLNSHKLQCNMSEEQPDKEQDFQLPKNCGHRNTFETTQIPE